MALSAFDDKSKPHQKDELAATLGETFGWQSDLPSGSRICLFNEPSGVTLAMIQAAKK